MKFTFPRLEGGHGDMYFSVVVELLYWLYKLCVFQPLHKPVLSTTSLAFRRCHFILFVLLYTTSHENGFVSLRGSF